MSQLTDDYMDGLARTGRIPLVPDTSGIPLVRDPWGLNVPDYDLDSKSDVPAVTRTAPSVVADGEVHTTSKTGGTKGTKPERMDLVPVGPLGTVARVYGFGAAKYDDHNWRRGYEWSKSYAAAMRHLTAFWGGEDVDPESGESHLAHVVFHMMSMMEWATTHPEYDDRYKPAVGLS